jgi:hypothetical protein
VAWVGLVPKQHPSGGKDKLGSISKRGDRYLRSLFTVGALAVIRYAKIHGTERRPWLTALLARKPTKVAAIALANKIASSGGGDSGVKFRKLTKTDHQRAFSHAGKIRLSKIVQNEARNDGQAVVTDAGRSPDCRNFLVWLHVTGSADASS